MQLIFNENTDSNIVYHGQIAISPFEKESFAKYRDWEESLVQFMVEQAKSPNLLSWQQLITSDKTLENACCCAMVLANSVEYGYCEQSRKLFQIAAQLKDITTDEFQTWLRSGWLDLPGIENSLQALLNFS